MNLEAHTYRYVMSHTSIQHELSTGKVHILDESGGAHIQVGTKHVLH